MPEEKKDKAAEETPEAKAEAKPKEKPAVEEKKQEEKSAPKQEPKKKVRPTNCALCNKAFKHKIWYYRNGKYFCTDRCWKKFTAENKKKESEKAAKEAPTSP